LDSKDQVLQINAILALGASGDKKAVAPLLTMAASKLPDDKRDALHRYLGHALFLNSPYNAYKGLLAESIEGVDHALLQPAVSRLLRCVDGQVRGFATAAVLKKLTPAQLRGPLWASMVRSLKECAPTFVMAASSSRMAFAEYLAENKIEEGLELLVQYIKLQKWHGCETRTPRILALIGKYGVHAKRIVPDLEEHVRYLTRIAETKGDGRGGGARRQIPLVQKGIAAIRQLTTEPELISIKQ
jgi:HEAT repeat protein